MSRRRVLALFRRVVSEIRRDRPSLALLFIAPIVITGLVTFILRESQPPQVTAVVVNLAGARGQLAGDALGAALRTGGADRHGRRRRGGRPRIHRGQVRLGGHRDPDRRRLRQPSGRQRDHERPRPRPAT